MPRPPMFSPISLNRRDVATDIAITVLASGGWHAMTLRSMGKAARVSGAAVAAWFGSVARLHEQVAGTYGGRWLRMLEGNVGAAVARGGGTITRSDLIRALLPTTWEDQVFHRIWLGIAEAGRWEENVGLVVANIEASERALVLRMLQRMAPSPGSSGSRASSAEDLEVEATLVTALVRGLRHVSCATEQPLPAELAQQAADWYDAAVRTPGGQTSERP